MKERKLLVAVEEIPDEGRALRGRLSAGWLGESLLDVYEAASELEYALELRRFDDAVYVEGYLRVDVSFACSRTLVEGRRELHVPIHELYQPAERHAVRLGSGVEAEGLEDDEDEPYLYEEGRIDLEPLLREQLLLAQDPYPVVESPPDHSEDEPLWSSGGDDIDPRWQKLKDIELG